MTAVLTATALRKWFTSGDERIVPVDGVDLALHAGEIVLVTGPTGSGKTTLMQMLTGFQRPDEGRVEWPGGGSMPSWSAVAVVPQSLGLLPELTVAENIALPLTAPGRTVAARVAAALTLLGVEQLADRLAGETSLGQQQRVAVARAIHRHLSGLAPVIALDEPSAALDAETEAELWRSVRGLADAAL